MLLEPHHDGSSLYVSTEYPHLGERVTVRVRVPNSIGVDRLAVRLVRDAEPYWVTMVPESPGRLAKVPESSGWLAKVPEAPGRDESWWSAAFEAHNPVTSYRFLTSGRAGYGWLNATGWHRERDVLDTFDFRVSAHPAPPDWVADAVVHQVFPDRFARSAEADSRDLPDWAEASRWEEPVRRVRGLYAYQCFGGDLDGLTEHLDHIARLGADVLYLTPVFPAGSNHRYDAASFSAVDPLLGGDEALIRLVRAAHARGIRVIGDLTTNHTGNRHAWFQAASADRDAPEVSYYFFEEHPHGYHGWLGHRTLPKLDWRSEHLRDAFLRGPDSVVGRWLRPPFDLDGWRIDVANMTGRYRDVDEALSVAREIRATMREVRPDAWLVAEHCHAAGPDLDGDGWHGTMNYAGFTRPVWTWLAAHLEGALPHNDFLGVPTGMGVPRLPGPAAVAALREANATMPWRSMAASMNALDTHDTARFMTVVGGDVGRYAAGLALLFTLPGVPMVFAGAETGIGGGDGELSRFPIPWDRPEEWNPDVLALHEQVAHLRRASPALRRGGLRWLSVGDDALTFEREAADGDERVLVHVSRAPHTAVNLPATWFDRAEPLLGEPSPVRGADGTWLLPADGPAAHVWRVS